MKKLILPIIFFLLTLMNCTDRKTEFTIWIGGAPQELDYWEELITEFESRTGYDLLLIRQPTYTDQRKQGLIVSLEAQQPNPDLFLMDVVWIDHFFKSGWLETLNPYMEKSDFSTEPFFSSVLESVNEYDGQYCSFPVFLDVGLLYYRKDLLEQNAYPGPPVTWDDLVKYSENIQAQQRKSNPGFNGYLWQGAQYEGLMCTFLEFIASNGGGFMADGRFKIDTPENIHALQFMQDLIYQYRISPPNTYTEMKEEEVRQAFQRGDALFERNWTYAWSLHQNPESPVKGKVGITRLPHFGQHTSVSTIGGWHIGISRYSDAKEAAWEFIRFITSYESQKNLLLRIGWTPGRSDVYGDEEIIAKIPHIRILEEALNNVATRPRLPYYSQVSDVTQRMVNNCLAGKMTPQEALENIQNEVDEITRIYGND